MATFLLVIAASVVTTVVLPTTVGVVGVIVPTSILGVIVWPGVRGIRSTIVVILISVVRIRISRLVGLVSIRVSVIGPAGTIVVASAVIGSLVPIIT